MGFIALMSGAALNAQVTIGYDKSPEPFSVLELISNETRGLRLPQLTTQERNDMQATPEFTTKATTDAMGLRIFNTDTRCVETWNGTVWIAECKDGVPCPAVVITSQTQQDITVPKNSNATLSVTVSAAAGTAPIYQWYDNATGTAITGATSASYTFPATASTYSFYCEVTSDKGACDPVSSVFNVTTIDLSIIQAGTGTFTGRLCFDVAKSNDDEKSGNLAMRQAIANGTASTADFSDQNINTQEYIFTPSGSVNNLRFYAVEPAIYAGQIIESLTYNTSLETQTGISEAQTVSIVYKNDLNDIAEGKYNTNAVKVNIYAIYRDNTGTDNVLMLTSTIQDCQCCGAYTTDGQWLNFMCHNLGADNTLNPFEWKYDGFNVDNDIKGYLYQWGRKTDGHQSRQYNAVDTYRPSTAEYNSAPIGTYPYSFWNSAEWVSDGSSPEGMRRWGDGTANANPAKRPNDPCPAGWKVPSQSQWGSIFMGSTISGAPGDATANTWTPTGTFSSTDGGGYMVGDALYLPAAGFRNWGFSSIYNSLQDIYVYCDYWSSTKGYTLVAGSTTVNVASGASPTQALSIRCVSE
jgi:uncharacterized protein (TIGR02145 family)